MDFWAVLYTAIFSIMCFESSFSNVLDRIKGVFCNIGEAFHTSGRKFLCRCCQHWTVLLSLLSQLACCLLEYDQCICAILDFLAGPDIDESSLPCVSPSLLDPCPASDCKAAFEDVHPLTGLSSKRGFLRPRFNNSSLIGQQRWSDDLHSHVSDHPPSKCWFFGRIWQSFLAAVQCVRWPPRPGTSPGLPLFIKVRACPWGL